MFVKLLRVTIVAIIHQVVENHHFDHLHDQVQEIQIEMEMYDQEVPLCYARVVNDLIQLDASMNATNHHCKF